MEHIRLASPIPKTLDVTITTAICIPMAKYALLVKVQAKLKKHSRVINALPTLKTSPNERYIKYDLRQVCTIVKGVGQVKKNLLIFKKKTK